MDSETTKVSAVNLFAYYVVVIGSIIAVGIFGFVNLYNDNLGRGLGLLVIFIILIRLFIWLEKSNMNGR